MNRDLEILKKNTADATMLVSRRPSDTDGHDGDIAMGATSSGVSLFMKVSNKWHEISSDESSDASTPAVRGTPFYINGGYDSSATNNFLPLADRKSEATGFGSGGSINHTTTIITPYTCRVLQLLVRSDTALGANSQASLYKAVDGSNIEGSGALIETSDAVNCQYANYVYSLNFSGDYDIPANNIIGVKLKTTGNQTKLVFTLVLDFDVIV